MSYIGATPTSTAFLTDSFSGDGSTTSFTLSAAPASSSSILVAVSGVLQDPATYAVVGTALNFTGAPPSGTANISVRYLGVPASNISTAAYRTVTEFTATAGQTSFSTPSYTVGFINVYRNGVLLGSADYTATTGTTVVLASGATAGDLITTESFYVSSIYNAISNTAGSVNSNNIADGAVTPSELSTGGPYWNTSGNVGIGTTSPTGRFSVTSAASQEYGAFDAPTSGYAFLRLRYNGTGYGNIGQGNAVVTGGAATDMGINATTNMLFATNGTTERMRIDSSGRVTTPYQPAFQAYCTGSTYITSGQVIPFNNTRFNTGSHFNTSTYRFTAPVAGVYCFQFQGYVASQNTWGNLQIRVSGSLYLYAETQAPYTQSLSPSMVVYLNAGDYVDSYWNTSAGKGFYLGSTESSFSGYLIG